MYRPSQNMGKIKPVPSARTGLLSFLPTNAPAQRFLVAAILAVLIGISSFFLISLSIKHQNWHAGPKNLAYIPNSDQFKGNVNKNLVDLPGGQFLPSIDYPLNILVMGVDSNGKNTQRFTATRSDTMMLVSIDPKNNRVAIVSIPRDSRVTIPDHGKDKINSAHAYGGPRLAAETVMQTFNVPVDRYLVVDEEGFRHLLDEFGPVDVLIEKKLSYIDHSGALTINLEPGMQKLDARQAEGYIRFRHDARGDIGRIERQQWFARQIANKLADPQIIIKLPQMLKVASDCIVTDLSVDEMVKLIGFACHTNANKIQMAMLPGKPDIIHGVSYWLPDPEATPAVFAKLTNISNSNAAPVADLGSAMAYTPTSSDSSDKFTVSIRYPNGCEQEADSLELMLTNAGFISKGKYKADLADCRHEQIIESTVHSLSADLKNKIPFLSQWPSAINIDLQAPADLVFVVTPSSQFTTSDIAQIKSPINQ